MPEWAAEEALSTERARSLIERRFRDLAPVRVRALGEGWDNWACLVNDRWIFRFPRRTIAAQLLRTEASVLPRIADRLPLAIPAPRYLGKPAEDFPWPFAGYERISGETACRARLDRGRRARAAEPVALFLRALHSIPFEKARAAGAGPDLLGRLEVETRRRRLAERLEALHARGLIESPAPWLALAQNTPSGWSPASSTLVHGDFYARHILVDPEGVPVGVIDWGDVHCGDRAVDLSIAHGFLPPEARECFRRAYGEIDEDTWRMARFRALWGAAALVSYAADTGDEALLREGLTALSFVRGAD
jgi:aminoglycoside phosphotransferase (APT) family kinase protein